jgi:hypothetical protein
MRSTLLSVIIFLFFLVAPALALEKSIAIFSYPDSTQGKIVFEIGSQGETGRLKAKFRANKYGPVVEPNVFVPTGKFWDEKVLTMDRKFAFVLFCIGSKVEGIWTCHDVYEFSVDEYLKDRDGYKLRKIALKTDLEEPRVHEIYSVSGSGDWLLVKAGGSSHVVLPKTGELKMEVEDLMARDSSYVLLTRTGELKQVEDLVNCEARVRD